MMQEEAKLDAMQRVWLSRRTGSSNSLFDKVIETENLLNLSSVLLGHQIQTNIKPCTQPIDVPLSCIDRNESEIWDNSTQDHFENKAALIETNEITPYLKLDASHLGDFPACYTVCSVEKHQFPVVGVFVDQRIVVGFKYRVRPLSSFHGKVQNNECLFGSRALVLDSIGRGYSRRFTFEADKNNLNKNDNYFWSDNRPEGYAFELEMVTDGDKYTIFDINGEAQGILEVLKNEGPQIEISNTVTRDGIEKRANVKLTGKVEFYETGVAKPLPLSGTAICVKAKGNRRAEVTKIINVFIKKCRYTLKPGFQKAYRRVSVRGLDIGDVPTRYTMTGLEPYEIPVVGTYVDPRIIPGFHYKVRPNDRKDHLFDGKCLKLLTIGMGYAKRLTFESESLIEANNYLWSDNHPDGLGLEPRAVHKGMTFIITSDDRVLGEATVFRADMPQMEEKTELLLTPDRKYAIQKYIHIDVCCHIRLNPLDCGSTMNDELMRVCGLAVVRKEPNAQESHVIRIENIGVDSQLSLLFAQTELTFFPKN